MPTTRPTTRQGWNKILQSTTNLSVRVANWQCQIPVSSVTRTWCQVFYLQDMSVPSMSKSITNVPCGPGQCNGLWQKANNSIDQSTMLDTSRGPQHGTRHSIYRMSELHQWMNFRRTRAGRTMPGANHSGRLLCMPIDPILGNSTGRSGRQHMKCKVCMLSCQAPFTGELLHQVGNRSWLIKKLQLYIPKSSASRDPGNYPRQPIQK